MVPQLPLFDVCNVDFPVLLRSIDAVQKAFSLLVLRKVEKELDDPGSATMEVAFQIDDGPVAIQPNGLRIIEWGRQTLGTENLGMHPNNENLFVIGPIEDADSPAFR